MKRVIVTLVLALGIVSMTLSTVGCGSGSPTKPTPTKP